MLRPHSGAQEEQNSLLHVKSGRYFTHSKIKIKKARFVKKNKIVPVMVSSGLTRPRRFSCQNILIVWLSKCLAFVKYKLFF